MTGSISEVSSASTWRRDIRRQRAPSVTESASAANGRAGARRATPAVLVRAGRAAVAVDSDTCGLLLAVAGGSGGGAAEWGAGLVAGGVPGQRTGFAGQVAGFVAGRAGGIPGQAGFVAVRAGGVSV